MYRLDKLQHGGQQRDAQALQQLEPRLALLAQRAAAQRQRGVVDPQLVLFRWMLEEYPSRCSPSRWGPPSRIHSATRQTVDAGGPLLNRPPVVYHTWTAVNADGWRFGDRDWQVLMNAQAVVFDLDGTLLDSLADIANAGNAVLAAHGFPCTRRRLSAVSGRRRAVVVCIGWCPATRQNQSC